MGNVISFNTGAQEWLVNDVPIVFNPADIFFVERLFNMFEALDRMQEEYSAKVEAETDNTALFKIVRDMDADMRTEINDVCGQDICTPLFGNMSVFASADGLPLWANLALAIMDTCDAEFAREKKATNPRLKKYIAKYEKRGKK